MSQVRTPAYPVPPGGLPSQDTLISQSDRAIVTNAYTVIPHAVHTDIVTMRLPHWRASRVWVIAKPIAGFSSTFSHYLMEIEPTGGSTNPEPGADVEAALFITAGSLELTINGSLLRWSLAALPTCRQVQNGVCTTKAATAHFHWIRKCYEAVPGITPPAPFVVNEANVTATAHLIRTTVGEQLDLWMPNDVSFDMHITIVSLEPGAVIPFLETHVMEHGLYVLQGKGMYRLNQDWVEVEAGDYMWLRAFCPQACYAGGPEPFRYLLYKDMHRHSKLGH